MTLSVRAATAADLDQLLDIAELMYADMGLATTPQWRAAAGEQLRQRLGDDLAGFLVEGPNGLAVSGGIGVITVRMPGPGNLAGQFGYIQWIATEPRWRGRGYARQVVSALLEWFATTGVTAVELHATRAGEPLYRSLGFDNHHNPGLRITVEPRRPG